MQDWNTYPSCPKCDATDYVYRGTRGNEDDPCEVCELTEGEPCVCHHHIEECRWRPLPGREKEVAEKVARAREKAAQAKDALLAAIAAIDNGHLADAYRLVDKAHDRTYEALCAVGVDSDKCLYSGLDYNLPQE